MNNPHRGEVLKDIRDAITKVPANKESPAQYWPHADQLIRLPTAYEKWAAAQNVHAVQLQHVQKGCLARPRDDIPSDGNRIEGWNSLRRSFASGLELQTALGHDFVLRRNLRIAFDGKIKSSDPFVLSTFGSHHVTLADYTASLWNELLPPAGGLLLAPLTILSENLGTGSPFR
ncbi:hypothetical protein C8J57DRAFT_1532183 [Mycena rebaudengoi]|nr:hypothetical protein C8J57DRAFT_1532183 [Mycena rebaudengoi]